MDDAFENCGPASRRRSRSRAEAMRAARSRHPAGHLRLVVDDEPEPARLLPFVRLPAVAAPGAPRPDPARAVVAGPLDPEDAA